MPPIPDFAGWSQAVEKHAARVLAGYPVGGEAREELEPVLGLLSENLKTCDVMARRAPGDLMALASVARNDYVELIPYLHEYGIEDKPLMEQLEHIRDALCQWLGPEGPKKGAPLAR